MNRALRALNRFGLGARVGERDTLTDPERWLLDQLDDARVARLDGPDADELSDVLRGLFEARRSRDQERLASARRELREVGQAEARASITRRITTDAPFLERLVAFWSNHLCVSSPAKIQVVPLAGHYEREVIRPHVLGSFTDMVLASAKHPAMLFYLDNFQSTGPGSVVGRRSSRRGPGRGLNENYARELLELHTLGVDGGYAQADVEALARILTGWTVSGAGPASRANEPVGFVFRPVLHEPGSKSVLGRRYGEAGVREGEAAIRDLCAHPSTARFVATKLVTHFVSDVPPPAAVGAIEETFLESGGDLREVSRALVQLDAAWEPSNRKLRTPQDWLVALFRSVRAPEAPRNIQGLLGQLRQPLWGPAAPKGYGDLEREWSDPDALMNRAELARSISNGASRRGGMEPRRLLDVVDTASDDPLLALVRDESISAQERVALIFGGPAFQWR